MRVTASHIATWANTRAKEAQGDLPRWIRRLCFQPESTRQISFPAGDSTYVPGWDGALFSEKGDAWVPVGASRWEIGCDQNVIGKANSDYLKRVEQMSDEERLVCTFVFVTPRRWIKKTCWVAEQCSKGEWADVRAYDADDLEQWLEQRPAVALQLAEELGLSGWGVVSLSRYWDSWARQCRPTITPEAVFMDRSAVIGELGKKIQEATIESDSTHPLVIRAESVEEAVAFTVAVVMSLGHLQNCALVVTEPQGWHYVEANPQLRIAIAARTEIAVNPTLRDDLQVIVPHATGDLAYRPTGTELILERPNIYEFEKALILIGMEESDAKRYAMSTGRSWTVLRRHRASNPAVHRPAWLDAQSASRLPILCLLGAWHANNLTDRKIVERLAACSYEELELDLRQLVLLDDAPLLNIGDVWKAKSPLELLGQCGGRIASSQLDRFFAIAKEMLSTNDPQLDLPVEDRWMAQLHGKVHPQSDLLFESVCDSLMKLAVRGPEQAGLQSLNIEDRVSNLVHELLNRGDGRRWLSLASYLPTLAEAAPDEFLRVVQNSLRMADAPVTALITESSESGLGGRCWHSGLLWALEVLAWSPRRLAAVTLVLAKLGQVPMKGNWGNKPIGCLLSIFRTWIPQTAANLPERIKVLELLCEKDSDTAFQLLLELAERGQQIAFPAQRPKWREDDAGAGHGVSYAEMDEMLDVVKDKLLQLSEGSAIRIVSLLQKTSFREKEEWFKVSGLIKPFTQASTSDQDRESIRIALRQIIHWHRNYDDLKTSELDKWLESVESCYEILLPRNLIIRYRWLFDNYWPELPSRGASDNSQELSNAITHQRISALTEIFQFAGTAGIESLIEVCAEPRVVGAVLVEVSWRNSLWRKWITASDEDFTAEANIAECITGFLRSLSSVASGALLEEVIILGKQCKWAPDKIARALSYAAPSGETWKLVEACGPEVSAAYWKVIQLNHYRDDERLGFVLERLLNAQRPLSALHYCQYSLEKTDVGQIFSALQQLIQSGGEIGLRLESWHLEKMLQRLETSEKIEKVELVKLEFGLFPLLQYGREVKAEALYEGVMSEPELFKDLVCLMCKPEHGEREELNENSSAAARRAWSILHSCKRMPGTRADGSIDVDIFNEFISNSRQLCCNADRAIMGDQTLGQILAHAPADDDGTWPFTPARVLLDDSDSEEIRHGFYIGTLNKRGSTIRSPLDGGSQERTLATHYKDMGARVQHTHPNVAAMLESVAKTYERDGRREDIQASLRKEEF